MEGMVAWNHLYLNILTGEILSRKCCSICVHQSQICSGHVWQTPMEQLDFCPPRAEKHGSESRITFGRPKLCRSRHGLLVMQTWPNASCLLGLAGLAEKPIIDCQADSCNNLRNHEKSWEHNMMITMDIKMYQDVSMIQINMYQWYNDSMIYLEKLPCTSQDDGKQILRSSSSSCRSCTPESLCLEPTLAMFCLGHPAA